MKNTFHELGCAEKLTVPPNIDYETKVKMMTAINDQRVVESKTLHEQIGFLCSLLRPDGIGLSYEKIGTLFSPHKSHSTIKRHFDSFQKKTKTSTKTRFAFTRTISNIVRKNPNGNCKHRESHFNEHHYIYK